MSIRKKIVSVCMCGLLTLGFITMVLTINTIQKQGKREIASIRATLIDEKKEKLKDLVRNTFAIIEANHRIANDKGEITRVYQKELKNIVNLTHKAVMEVYRSKDLDEGTKKAIALSMVKALRYNKSDYLWINDIKPAMVMHPIKPALDGKDLSDFKDPNGKKLFVEFVAVCQKKR